MMVGLEIQFLNAPRERGNSTLHVTAGVHVLRLETVTSLCPDSAASHETTVAAGSHQVFRILMPAESGLRLTRVE
jgi:hypothetical protein